MIFSDLFQICFNPEFIIEVIWVQGIEDFDYSDKRALNCILAQNTSGNLRLVFYTDASRVPNLGEEIDKWAIGDMLVKYMNRTRGTIPRTVIHVARDTPIGWAAVGSLHWSFGTCVNETAAIGRLVSGVFCTYRLP